MDNTIKVVRRTVLDIQMVTLTYFQFFMLTDYDSIFERYYVCSTKFN